VGQTQVRLDEGGQAVNRDGCLPRIQRPLHEPQVDRADDGGLVLGDFEERAMTQSDLRFAVRFPPLRRESELVEEADQPIDRLLRTCGLSRRAGHPACPRPAGLQCLGAGVAVTGQAQGENLGEQPVAPSPAGVHPTDRPEHQRRTPQAPVVRFHAFDPAVGDQRVQMEADGVRMHPKLIRDLRDRQRTGRTPQRGQHVFATHSCALVRPETSGVSTPSGPVFTAPPGDLANRADVEVLLRRFYCRVFADDVLAEPFAELRAKGLESHLPVMCDFWETVLFRAGLYHRNALVVHRQLDDRQPLCAKDFVRWLELWNVTVDEMYRGPVADRAKVQAARIAKSIHRRLRGVDASELDALSVA
jgi:hemoglobin